MNNTDRPSSNLDSFYASCNELADKISSKHYDLVALLSSYETHETIQDEVKRSTDALRGMREEHKQIQNPLSGLTISTIFPLNLPLYSLVIFGVAPSAFAANVFIRPPEVMHEVLHELFDLLEIERLFPKISLHHINRQAFMELYAADSDVVLFTGKYENAMAIHNSCPDALLVYNGSGINPFVVLDNADIDLAAEKAVEMRCFNSGQDCAGPDAFFVSDKIADKFIDRLKFYLKNVKVGESMDPEVRVSKTIKETYIDQLQHYFEKEKDSVVYGGKIDRKKNLVYPTILRKSIEEQEPEFHEFFAPFFNVVEFQSIKDLEKVILASSFKEHTMYISVFGDDESLVEKLPFATVLKNQIVNDVEYGNDQYGGYGEKSNFLLYKGKKITKPVLISRDIHEILQSA